MSSEPTRDLTELGKEITNSLLTYIARLYSINRYVRRFNHQIFRHDVQSEILTLSRQRAILNSIDDDNDEAIQQDIKLFDKQIEQLRESLKIFSQTKDSESEKISNSKREDFNYLVSIQENEFYIDPSVLPSSMSFFHQSESLFTYFHFLKTQFIGLITEFELLLAKLVRTFYTMYEGSLSHKEVKIKVEDIKRFSNVDEIIDYLIEGEIFKLTAGSLDDWKIFLNERFDIKLATVTPSWEKFNEYFARRNLYVHNDGVVNDEYQRRIKDSKYQIDDILEISPQYFQDVLEDFLLIGSTIAYMTWNKLSPNEKNLISSSLNDLGYYALVEKHWKLAERMYKLLEMYGDDADKMTAKMNTYLCKKRQGEFDKIEGELKNFQHNMYSARFSVAVYALLNDSAKATEYAAQSDLELGDLLEWPILEDLRGTEEFDSYVIEILQDQAIQVIDEEKIGSMTLKQLKALAKSNGLKVSASVSKANILPLLISHKKKQDDVQSSS